MKNTDNLRSPITGAHCLSMRTRGQIPCLVQTKTRDEPRMPARMAYRCGIGGAGGIEVNGAGGSLLNGVGGCPVPGGGIRFERTGAPSEGKAGRMLTLRAGATTATLGLSVEDESVACGAKGFKAASATDAPAPTALTAPNTITRLRFFLFMSCFLTERLIFSIADADGSSTARFRCRLTPKRLAQEQR